MTDNVFWLRSRQEELEWAVRKIVDGDCTLAYLGLHQMGKRVFADALARRLREMGMIVVSVVANEIEPTCESICNQLSAAGVDLDRESLEEDLDRAYCYVRMIEDGLRTRANRSLRIVLLISDFDKGHFGGSFLKYLLSFFDDPVGLGISSVLFMNRTLEMMLDHEKASVTAPAGRFYDENRRTLEPYKIDDVRDWCRQCGIVDQGEEVWSVTRGHPELMRLIQKGVREGLSVGQCISSYRDDFEMYYDRLSKFLASIGVDPGCNERVRTLLDALVCGINHEKISATARIFLKRYGFDIESSNVLSHEFNSFLKNAGYVKEKKLDNLKQICINGAQRIEALRKEGDVDLRGEGERRSEASSGEKFIRKRADFISDAKINFKESKRPMMLYGKTGAGKSRLVEDLVRELAKEGLMAAEAFVSISPDDFDAEHPQSTLMGHDPLAWTGCSDKVEEGVFKQAHNGVLFIDEAENIPLPLQQAMLRPLQTKEVHRVAASGQGSRVEPKSEFMPIFATNVSPDELLKNKVWRQDFMDRIAGWYDYEVEPELDVFEKVSACVDEYLRVTYKNTVQISADDMAKRCIFSWVKKYVSDRGWRQVEQLLANLALDAQKAAGVQSKIVITGKFVVDNLSAKGMGIDDQLRTLIDEENVFSANVDAKLILRGVKVEDIGVETREQFYRLIKIVLRNKAKGRDEIAGLLAESLAMRNSETGPKNRLVRLLAKMGFGQAFKSFQEWVLIEFREEMS